MFCLKTGKRYNKCIRKLNKISMTNGMFERGKKKMAYIIPECPTFKTRGEEKLFNALKANLDDLWTVYYEPVINGKYPDFILFHEYYGILILEVKDYTTQTILEIRKDYWKIYSQGKEVSIKNPFSQAIEYRNELINLLSKHKELVEQEGNFQGKLKFPVAVGCVFVDLTASDIINLCIDQVIPLEQLFCMEDLEDSHVFNEKINGIMETLFTINSLSREEARIVKQVIYPVIKVNYSGQVDRSLEEEQQTGKEEKERKEILNVQLISFEHYVDEFYYVVDRIHHLCQTGAARNITIAYPLNRFLRRGTVKEFISDLLKSRGLLAKRGLTLKLFELEQLSDYCRSTDYLFIVDINSIRSTAVYERQLRPIIEGKIYNGPIMLTANKPSWLTKKLKNRLAQR
ncbi:hypothetical protein JCM14450A_05290 [Geobacillus stearothermophilus]